MRRAIPRWRSSEQARAFPAPTSPGSISRRWIPRASGRRSAALVEKFRAAAKPSLLRDDPENLEWKNAMVAALIGRENELVTEGDLLGLSAEFFMQIEWLPGGRMEEGELMLDPVLDVAEAGGGPGEHLRDEKSRKFILNFVREYGDLEFVNVGRVIGSLSRRAAMPGRRGVYIAALKQRQNPAEIVTIIRLQKQGVREYLEQGLSLLDAMISAEEYTEYILDRRLGCRQLGMNLPLRVTAKKISERYAPARGAGYPIWTPYFEREYIRGIATDKLPPALFESREFAVSCAHLLGQAAAPNIVVGRCDRTGSPLFDDGDEVMILDAGGHAAGHRGGRSHGHVQRLRLPAGGVHGEVRAARHPAAGLSSGPGRLRAGVLRRVRGAAPEDPGGLSTETEGLRLAFPAPARAGTRQLRLQVEEGPRPPGRNQPARARRPGPRQHRALSRMNE